MTDMNIGELPLPREQVVRIVRMALEEDAPHGDLTSQAFVPASAHAEAEVVAREAGVFSGAEVLRSVFAEIDEHIGVGCEVEDGEAFAAGARLAVVRGPARAVLRGERVALNLLQRMCGIATLTARYVAAAQQTAPRVRVVDTRKTTPGLRILERHAVRCGGGHNHRFSLSEAVMAKDNHLALVHNLTAAIQSARAQLPHTTHIEVEVDRLDQIETVLAGGADTIMLDNFSPEDLRRGVALIDGRAIVEASGGITLETISEVAATGVDVISVGALTHSVRSLDLGLDLRLAQE
ncbi:nicotinate-nucleotide pyrophosphorylase [carboxylating] [Bogoriella caseilytica]|uniref:Nicotinate-nucleotide pyrophosphorylase [carboxylating] n=2 Tax=Bogoriella caseilytica TaxID=56055 RepID=A0A3N2B8X6_9MICO|nr:nicotinate-nucleotide pyrophosphorylase [carboxylating] [Bogoriella caseilytica]